MTSSGDSLPAILLLWLAILKIWKMSALNKSLHSTQFVGTAMQVWDRKCRGHVHSWVRHFNIRTYRTKEASEGDNIISICLLLNAFVCCPVGYKHINFFMFCLMVNKQLLLHSYQNKSALTFWCCKHSLHVFVTPNLYFVVKPMHIYREL